MGEVVSGITTAVVEILEPANEGDELLGFQAIVHPDGADASLTLLTSNGDLRLSASRYQIAAAHSEIRNAAVLMQYRQCMKKDKDEAALDGLLRAALRPVESTCVIDPETGSHYYVMQFSDRLPIAVMLTLEQVLVLRAGTSAEIKRTAN